MNKLLQISGKLLCKHMIGKVVDDSNIWSCLRTELAVSIIPKYVITTMMGLTKEYICVILTNMYNDKNEMYIGQKDTLVVVFEVNCENIVTSILG